MGTAGGVAPTATPVSGAAGQGRHARVRAGVAAARGLSARPRQRRRPGRRAPGGDRVRRRQAPGAVPPRPPATPPRSGAVSAPTWPRPPPRTPWHSWGPSDDEPHPAARGASQGAAPADFLARVRHRRAALCPRRARLSPRPVPPLRAGAPRSRAARHRAPHQGRQVPGLEPGPPSHGPSVRSGRPWACCRGRRLARRAGSLPWDAGSRSTD